VSWPLGPKRAGARPLSNRDRSRLLLGVVTDHGGDPELGGSFPGPVAVAPGSGLIASGSVDLVTQRLAVEVAAEVVGEKQLGWFMACRVAAC
jgi:hypothetical protein